MPRAHELPKTRAVQNVRDAQFNFGGCAPKTIPFRLLEQVPREQSAARYARSDEQTGAIGTQRFVPTDRIPIRRKGFVS